jgi:hypothetical protein
MGNRKSVKTTKIIELIKNLNDKIEDKTERILLNEIINQMLINEILFDELIKEVSED